MKKKARLSDICTVAPILISIYVQFCISTIIIDRIEVTSREETAQLSQKLVMTSLFHIIICKLLHLRQYCKGRLFCSTIDCVISIANIVKMMIKKLSELCLRAFYLYNWCLSSSFFICDERFFNYWLFVSGIGVIVKRWVREKS